MKHNQKLLPYEEEQKLIAESIGIDNGISYSPVDIERWCKLKITSYFTPEKEKDEIVDMLCEYFIASPMRPSSRNKYFIKRRKPDGRLILVRDRNISKTYRVMRSNAYVDIELTQQEKEKFEFTFMKLGVRVQIEEL